MQPTHDSILSTASSFNVSSVSDLDTATTHRDCAGQRAAYLAVLGVKSVLELCVGPSLGVLESAYRAVGIEVTGNDIDSRWRRFYPEGRWIIGDAETVPISEYDAVVFAPPLSRGCTGRREDALRIDQVRPRYQDFIGRLDEVRGVAVLVLPARSFATSRDREQFFKLTASLPVVPEVVPLILGRRKITKYLDLYLDLRR